MSPRSHSGTRVAHKTAIRVNGIYCGDSREALSQIASGSVDLIMTSPPYAEKRITSYGGMPPSKYVEWFLPITKQLLRLLKPRGSFVLNIKEHPIDGERQTYVLDLILEMRKQGWRWIEEYCWYKKNSFPGKWNNRFRDSWERCLHFSKQKEFNMYQDSVTVPIGAWAERRFRSMSANDFVVHASKNNKHLYRRVANWLGKTDVYPHNVLVFESEHFLRPSNVIEFATECKNKNHSASFPIELPTWFIRLFTKENDIVLDPFVGAGTTAVAAKALGRRYIGIDIQKEYAQEARRKLREIDWRD